MLPYIVADLSVICSAGTIIELSKLYKTDNSVLDLSYAVVVYPAWRKSGQ